MEEKIKELKKQVLESALELVDLMNGDCSYEELETRQKWLLSDIKELKKEYVTKELLELEEHVILVTEVTMKMREAEQKLEQKLTDFIKE